MDEQRQIRFLYPPFFLIGSLLWGVYLDPTTKLGDLLAFIPSGIQWPQAITLLVGGSVLVIALGFLIGTLSLSLLRLLFFVFSLCRDHWYHFEASVSSECLAKIWPILHLPAQPDQSNMFRAVVTFDHEMLSRPVHDWLRRRWSGFLISTHSAVALLLALILGWRLPMRVTSEWVLTSCALVLLFAWCAVAA